MDGIAAGCAAIAIPAPVADGGGAAEAGAVEAAGAAAVAADGLTKMERRGPAPLSQGLSSVPIASG